jgi:hypothetical protein
MLQERQGFSLWTTCNIPSHTVFIPGASRQWPYGAIAPNEVSQDDSTRCDSQISPTETISILGLHFPFNNMAFHMETHSQARQRRLGDYGRNPSRDDKHACSAGNQIFQPACRSSDRTDVRTSLHNGKTVGVMTAAACSGVECCPGMWRGEARPGLERSMGDET